MKALRILACLAISLVAVVMTAYVVYLRMHIDATMDELIAQSRQELEVSDDTLELGPAPTALAMETPLKVMGLKSELCVLVLEDIVSEGDNRAQLERATGGARVGAVLHARSGADYGWEDGSWVFPFTDFEGRKGDLYACLTSEDSENPLPPVGTEFIAVDLRADRPLRVHGVTWRSTSSQDHVVDPPADELVESSAEYRGLEAAFGGQPAWDGLGRMMLQVELSRRFPHDGYPQSDFNSSLSLHVRGDALQLQPRADAVGMRPLTIPASAVPACVVTYGFRGAAGAQLYLHDQGIRVSFLDAPEVVDWCWSNRIRLLDCKERSDWYYKQASLVPAPPDDARFVDRDAWHAAAQCGKKAAPATTGY